MEQQMNPNPTPSEPEQPVETRKPATPEETLALLAESRKQAQIMKQNAEELAARTALVLEEDYGIKKGAIPAWKKQFGSVQVIFIEDIPYIIRGISRMEWKAINRQPQPQGAGADQVLSLEEEVTRLALLSPKFDQATMGEAGIPTVVFNAVLRISKFEPDLPPIKL